MGLARDHHAGAVFSDCGKYRYVLWRCLTGRFDEPHTSVLWLMLNPSTANATKLDPTLTRCLAYTKAWGYQQMAVVNVFAFRSTNPKGLLSAVDPVGAENDQHIGIEAAGADLVVCGWGEGVPTWARHRIDDVARELERAGKVPHALAVTGAGNPSHPLYLKADLSPRPISELLAERRAA
jgi:hypothetical protein